VSRRRKRARSWARRGACSCLSALLLAALTVTAAAAEDGGARFIVKLRAPAGSAQGVRQLAVRHGLATTEARALLGDLELLRVAPAAGASAAQLLTELRADPQVEFAEPDERRHALTLPDDPLFAQQWYLQDGQLAALDALDAWTLSSGAPGLVIAELDTGVRFEHPDLRNAGGNRLLPGFNFISDPRIANNGYGRGADASDPGDWVSVADLEDPLFAHCPVANSSWHGTRVAGILGALSDNGLGMTGTTWQGWIEPVRVLGKCGGYDSDIITAMAWAAGEAVPGVPANQYPANIINMSLGAVGPCPASYQEVINQLTAQGVLVVVAAGNEGGPVDAPANCAGVVAVAGLREVGTKVGFSSLGPQIALSAPAGNCVNTAFGAPCLFSILTTTNSGLTRPLASTYTDDYNYNLGTSFAAPLVSATAGLMLAVNGNLSPPQLIERLQAGAKTPFPAANGLPECHVPVDAQDIQASECGCTTSTCGAGMANAYGAVLEAQRPIAAVALTASYSPGGALTLDASGSSAACDATLVSYQWRAVASGAPPPQLSNASGARVSLAAPVAPQRYTLRLTVTDEQGRTDSAVVSITADGISSSAPARAGAHACLRQRAFALAANNGGGSGALDALTLLALLLAVQAAYSRRCAASSQERCARR
jgi:serine protease